MHKFTLVLISLLFSCTPKINTELLSSSKESRSHLNYLPFAIIETETDTINQNQNEILGKIEIKDSGLSINCDFESIKEIAKKESLKLGENCFVITEHKKPSKWSTCHRIKADVYYINNPQDFEEEIQWNEKRKLKIEDFKGTTEKRPFTAATVSSFRYLLSTKTGYSKHYTIKATTFFDCKTSYFKHSTSDSIVLAHEQIHFDISELYARKFLIRMEKEAKSVKEALEIQQKVLNDISRELQLKQDEYDSEVYADRLKQPKWNKWINLELEKTNSYKSKIITSKK